jgi:hypothetical protein
LFRQRMHVAKLRMANAPVATSSSVTGRPSIVRAIHWRMKHPVGSNAKVFDSTPVLSPLL